MQWIACQCMSTFYAKLVQDSVADLMVWWCFFFSSSLYNE